MSSSIKQIPAKSFMDKESLAQLIKLVEASYPKKTGMARSKVDLPMKSLEAEIEIGKGDKAQRFKVIMIFLWIRDVEPQNWLLYQLYLVGKDLRIVELTDL